MPARGVLRNAYITDEAASFLDAALSRRMADASADDEDPAADVGTNALVWRQLQLAARPMVLNADERHPALTMLTAFGRRPAHA